MWRGVIVCVVISACSDGPKPTVHPVADAAPVQHPACDVVGAAGCSPGQTCVFEYGTGSGTCLNTGPAALGSPCDLTADSTGCLDGVCRDGVCVAFCDPFAISAATPCPALEVCGLGFDCSIASNETDAASAEHFCAASSKAPCAVDGGRARGLCTTVYSTTTCRKLCHVATPSDCAPGFVCAQPTATAVGGLLGVCMPALDQSACVDGGTGTCAECLAVEQGTGGCCEMQAASCTSQACRDFVACAIACKRGRTCVEGCVAANATGAAEGTPLFLCLSSFGSPSAGACGDVCDGLPVCGDFDGPDTASTCTGCDPAMSSCRANGCFNGFYCNRTTMMCTAPANVPSCTN